MISCIIIVCILLNCRVLRKFNTTTASTWDVPGRGSDLDDRSTGHWPTDTFLNSLQIFRAEFRKEVENKEWKKAERFTVFRFHALK